MHLRPTIQNTKLTVICATKLWLHVLAGFLKVKVSANFDFIYESLKKMQIKFYSSCLLNRENYIRKSAFEEKNKKSGLKFNPGLVLISLRTTGIRSATLNRWQGPIQD